MTDRKFIIEESDIEEIDRCLKNHSTISVRGILKQLPLFIEKEILKKFGVVLKEDLFGGSKIQTDNDMIEIIDKLIKEWK